MKFFPFTVIDPEDGDTVYPATGPMVKEYVPSGAENVMILDVEFSSVPLNVTDHNVSDFKPDSSKMTLYLETLTDEREKVN